MKTAYSEFRKKGNPVWNFFALEVPFAINPFEKLPTGRVKNPEETKFEDTDSDDDLPVEFAETLENVDRGIVDKHVDNKNHSFAAPRTTKIIFKTVTNTTR
jgi:hypothetical protein